jgi:hypothetical protein
MESDGRWERKFDKNAGTDGKENIRSGFLYA